MYDFITLAYKKHKEALKMLTEVLKINTVLDKYDPKSDAPFGIGNKECLELFSKYAEKDGFIYKNVDNYAMHIEIGEGEELLGILGHLDVVPATGNWDSDPFNPVIKNNKVYARGALDDKGPVVCAYYALKILKEINVKFNKRVRLILGSDEESESRCLNYYFKKEEMPSLGFSPDAEFPLIYGEKAMQFFTVYGELDEDSIIESFTSGDRVNIVPDYCEAVLKKNVEREFSEYLIRNNYKGKVIGNKYIVEGKSSHGSMPENGVNAAFIMIEFINMIEPCNFTRFVCDYLSFDTYGKKLNIDIKTNDMGSLTINPGVFNISKNKFSIEVDCRIPSDNMFDTIKNRLNKACSEYSGISYKLSKPKYMHYVDPDSELVKTLYKSYTDITGDYENKPYTIGGGTYAKFIPNCVAFGPCFPNEESKIHEPNEYISIETFIKNIAIYAKSIYELVK